MFWIAVRTGYLILAPKFVLCNLRTRTRTHTHTQNRTNFIIAVTETLWKRPPRKIFPIKNCRSDGELLQLIKQAATQLREQSQINKNSHHAANNNRGDNYKQQKPST